MSKVYHLTKVIDGVTATTTAGAVSIRGADKVMLIVQRAAHGSGSSAFTATVSQDGTNYIDYDKWIDNVAATNSQTVAKVTTKTLSANGTDFVTMSPEDGFLDIIVKVTETTDGTHSAWVYTEEEC